MRKLSLALLLVFALIGFSQTLHRFTGIDVDSAYIRNTARFGGDVSFSDDLWLLGGKYLWLVNGADSSKIRNDGTNIVLTDNDGSATYLSLVGMGLSLDGGGNIVGKDVSSDSLIFTETNLVFSGVSVFNDRIFVRGNDIDSTDVLSFSLGGATITNTSAGVLTLDEDTVYVDGFIKSDVADSATISVNSYSSDSAVVAATAHFADSSSVADRVKTLVLRHLWADSTVDAKIYVDTTGYATTLFRKPIVLSFKNHLIATSYRWIKADTIRVGIAIADSPGATGDSLLINIIR